MNRNAGWKDALLLIVLLVAGGFLGRMQSGGQASGRSDPLGSVLQTVVSPISNTSGRVAQSATLFFSGIRDARSLAAENDLLKNRLKALEMYETTVRRMANEIESLRTLGGLPRYGKKPVNTEITGFFPYENRVTLGVGSRQGIEAGMPVVAAQGLLGIVKSVSASSCSVLLLTAPSQKLGAIVIDRDPPPAGLMRGDGENGYVIEFQDPKVPVQTGDTVTTAGFSEKIPRGIIIGRVLVSEVDVEFGVLRARVLPAVTLGRVREVVVLK